MKKFVLGLVTGIVLAGLTLLIVSFALMRFGERRPEVADGSTLILKVEGEVPERAPVEIPLPFFESQSPMTVTDIWAILRKAAADNRVKAVIFMPKDVGAGWGKLDEIRQNLLEFKKSGKPLIAYLMAPGTREYYLATAADSIYMSREDLLDVKGLRAELMYLRGSLDKLGVDVEIEHIGKYKDFGDMFTRTSPSAETLTVMNSMLDGIYGRLLSGIASSRKLTGDQVSAAIDQGPFLATEAKSKGLIDDLYYEDQVYGEVKKRLKQSEIKKLSHRDYLRVPAASLGLEGRHKIAMIVGEGSITRGGGESPLPGDDGITPGNLSKLLREVRNDASVKGVVLRVDSPGGDAVASDEILREVKLLSKAKPLVVSMSDVAASGGYYIAASGDPIVAYPNTITGSIGVVFGKVNLRGLYEKLGVRKEILTRGQFADIDSDYKPLTPAGRKKMREGMEEIYRAFVERVAEGRNRPYEEIEPLAQGRVWLGSQAKENGLVDSLGGIDTAIAMVKQKAKIPENEKVRLVTNPPKRSIFDQFLTRPAEAILDSRLRALIRQLDLNPWLDGGIMRIMPFRVVIQ